MAHIADILVEYFPEGTEFSVGDTLESLEIYTGGVPTPSAQDLVAAERTVITAREAKATKKATRKARLQAKRDSVNAAASVAALRTSVAEFMDIVLDEVIE